ncbi:hypothetical protein MTBBW1_2380031 [Desulfamplus magnetovallimortis]|uniref:Uncharacterized protein n=1 Tax=Desulfamplus magnetovallimortis TaxID=1246637 RepID=A0A1W1HDY8_9BACT|nr:hypothetical protein MTBBW1_2380031 [Desulfamplus magnetovallimortis]
MKVGNRGWYELMKRTVWGFLANTLTGKKRHTNKEARAMAQKRGAAMVVLALIIAILMEYACLHRLSDGVFVIESPVQFYEFFN